jgi:hypothetical protein
MVRFKSSIYLSLSNCYLAQDAIMGMRASINHLLRYISISDYFPRMRIVSIDPIGLLLARTILVHGQLQRQRRVCLNPYLLVGPEESPDSNNCMHRRSLRARACKILELILWLYNKLCTSRTFFIHQPMNLIIKLNAWNRQRSVY